MPAFAYEYQLAKQDAVSFLWQTQPVRVLGENGYVCGLECVRTELGAPDAKGPAKPRPVPGTEFESTWTWLCAPSGKSRRRIF